jgi:hypothetical protein
MRRERKLTAVNVCRRGNLVLLKGRVGTSYKALGTGKRLLLFVFRLKSSLEEKYVAFGGIILAGEKQITRKKATPRTTLQNTKLTRTSPGSNTGLSCDKTANIFFIQCYPISEGPLLSERLPGFARLSFW